MKKRPYCKRCGHFGHYQYQCWSKPKTTPHKKILSKPSKTRSKGILGSKTSIISSKKKTSNVAKYERRKLIKELDKYTSLICRIGASDKNGEAYCYTCGKKDIYKNLDCGHYISRKYQATRWLQSNVRPQCLTKGHRVGNKDISEVKVGDIVPSLFGETEVVGTGFFTSPIVEIEAGAKHIKSSPEHRILVERNSKLIWLSAIQIYRELEKGVSLYIIEV